jgi:hypothetical protein
MASNEAAVELEAPFDGERNSIPIGHYYYELLEDLVALQSHVPNVDGSGEVNLIHIGFHGDRNSLLSRNKNQIHEYLIERKTIRKLRQSFIARRLQGFISSSEKEKNDEQQQQQQQQQAAATTTSNINGVPITTKQPTRRFFSRAGTVSNIGGGNNNTYYQPFFDETANPAELRAKGKFGTML